MCGIAGIISAGHLETADVRRMIEPLVHRGPDDEGIWRDAEARIGLGHRRLSIVDLSPLGHQPMASRDGRFILSYNGEIYNHLALRADLDASGLANEWRGHSDTETLIECIASWGLEATLKKAVGMFAVALWDKRDRLLLLARDRFGEKPLYYGWVGGDFLFGSELKALTGHPRFDNAVDRRALRLLASRTYIPAPLSIYQHIYKLEPGCILSADRGICSRRPSTPPQADATSEGPDIRRYWAYREVVQAGLREPIADEREALDELEQVLAQAIKGQSVADVPVGAFLSGGFDSSTVVGLYQKYSSQTVRTFSIGFAEAGFNEAEYAKKVAAHFGTDHNERYVTVKETQEVIPLLPTMYDEPFADSSQIPTHLVSRFAREQVTVALSGDGGDELFGGYNRYLGAARLWSVLRRLPRPARAAIGQGFGAVPPGAWDGLVGLLPGERRPPHFGTKVKKGLRTAGTANSLDDVFMTFLDQWSGENSPVTGGQADPGLCEFDLHLGEDAPDATRMMYCDAVSYLPDDILCKVDRAAMAVSLETRVPFLDHRVAALAARIPIEMKIKGGKGKHLLRQLLYREAPRALFERPKAGFAIPVGEWVKGPLREWAEDLLDERTLRDQGHFDAGQIRRRWAEHLSGKRDATQSLWPILMFQAWSAEQRGNPHLERAHAA